MQLAVDHPDRVKAAMAPISRMMLELVDDANAAGAIDVADTRRAAALDAADGDVQLVRQPARRERPACASPPRRPGSSASTASALSRSAGQTRSRSSIRIALPRRTLYRCSSVSDAVIRSTSSRANGHVVSVCG